MTTAFDEIKSGRMPAKFARAFLKKENASHSAHFCKMPGEHPDVNYLGAVRNNKFLVQMFKEGENVRLSINRTELNKDATSWKDGITWDEIYNIKNKLGYADYCAIEIYPPVKDLVNVANIRHIFILKTAPDFMWKA